MWNLHGASPLRTLRHDHASGRQVLRSVRKSTCVMLQRANRNIHSKHVGFPLVGISRTVLVAAALWGTSTVTLAQIKVENAWVRSTVAQQQATGAFMKITSPQAVKLVAITAPAAQTIEIHEMKMEGDVMKMRAHPNGLDIPANTPVELKSGGYHLMMMELAGTITAGSTIPLQLHFTDTKGNKQTVTVQAKAGFKNPYTP